MAIELAEDNEAAAEAVLAAFEKALGSYHRTHADPYADAEDRGDARRAVERTRAAVLVALAPEPRA